MSTTFTFTDEAGKVHTITDEAHAMLCAAIDEVGCAWPSIEDFRLGVWRMMENIAHDLRTGEQSIGSLPHGYGWESWGGNARLEQYHTSATLWADLGAWRVSLDNIPKHPAVHTIDRVQAEVVELLDVLALYGAQKWLDMERHAEVSA